MSTPPLSEMMDDVCSFSLDNTDDLCPVSDDGRRVLVPHNR